MGGGHTDIAHKNVIQWHRSGITAHGPSRIKPTKRQSTVQNVVERFFLGLAVRSIAQRDVVIGLESSSPRCGVVVVV
jgi:hypothetical protein